ncbi:hypothetical protein RB614_11445 [Phytohabitans sp. ZYX-F-186]|uniref:Uncharacterized protein n=1 Tax=Phytohabitans maris TaxID=3071409 RepID=A0ABU0ZFE1_9ACTN|nr:hypothetical protein [Phytohabitans sp. ZYX-F-186]MDQ7905136.1 hypothetical protein [Phytohabitans sp. ZYX-F-186]
MRRRQELLQQPEARAEPYPDQVAALRCLLAGRYRAGDGTPASAFPGGAADVEVWALGSSGGERERALVADRRAPTSPGWRRSSSRGWQRCGG